ncbi:HLA class II histocompatibility antigen, DP beta 1 chain-like [Pongo abelii]|uniref:HLA class II histocompatibility antigen, DP beta 1 chain-like n=1 Tax=Pongo abelii TaxID=9601 RepID=UPI003005B60E
MMILQVSGGPWTVALTALLMVLLISVVQAAATPENSVYQERQECYAFSGTQRFVDGLIYNREEYVHFDSAVGEFLTVMELGRPMAECLNSQKDFMERKRAVMDTVCRHKYELMEPLIRQRREVQSDSVQSKTLTGAGGFMLGLIICGLGIFMHRRSKKGAQRTAHLHQIQTYTPQRVCVSAQTLHTLTHGLLHEGEEDCRMVNM